MLESKEMFINFCSKAIHAGSAAIESAKLSPVVQAAQPLISSLGILLGMCSGYELGRSLTLNCRVYLLKAKGLWVPSMLRPIALLVATAALAVLATPVMVTAIGAATAGAILFGIFKGAREKENPGNMDLEAFENRFNIDFEDTAETTPQDFLTTDNPSIEDAHNLVWGLMQTACERGEGFTEGAFVLEGEEAKAIYNKLSAVEGSYKRSSSHFSGRSTAKYPQKGLDFPGSLTLPAGKRTILFGLASTNDGKKILFIKPENWGADHSLSSLIRTKGKFKHLVNHSLEFFHAQYVKLIRPGYDDRPGTAKERIPHNWKNSVNKIGKFGWSDLAATDRQLLVDKQNVKKSWLDDVYRTGREVYIKLSV